LKENGPGCIRRGRQVSSPDEGHAPIEDAKLNVVTNRGGKHCGRSKSLGNPSKAEHAPKLCGAQATARSV